MDGTVILFEKEIGQIEWVNNQIRKYDIKEQPNLIKRLTLHCRISVTTQTSSVDQVADAPFNLIANIQVRTSQGLVLKNFDGYSINALNMYETGTPAHNTIPANLDAGTHVFEFDIIIPFDDITNRLVERTILNSNEYNDLAIYITWADFAVISGDWAGGATDIVNYFYCDLISCERPPVEIDGDRRNDELLARQRMIDNVVTTDATPETRFLLPENTNIKTLMLITRDAAGLRSNLIIDRLKVDFDSGNFVLRDWSGSQCRSQNKQYYHVESLETGVYIIEFDQNHDFKTLFSTKGRNYARLIVTEVAAPVSGASMDLFRRRIATPKQITE